ncbi:ammonium transporter [Dubosiella newyorkensis]|jgi:Amt family ammonium transporter|uniref:ammonium transporter n=2 Tax=Dubosiella newyorkensis TaxID=1862672 RepID=UPI0023537295|nr:ammonium transporter [Dubosiella newyorkensis]MCI9041619.1 ammonium transporter [Dubosiella newyorkensis]
MIEEVLSQVFGIWFLIGAALVFFMQAGFAMVEAGFTRAKNAGNIIMKNTMDFCLGTVAFLLLGFSLLCGAQGNSFIGWGGHPLTDFAGTDWSTFTFNLVFCATAATIVSGAMAERTKFISYCVYSFIISLVIYPIEAHWVWGPDGFLTGMGFHDFAGSAVIHFAGGLCAFIGAAMLGARIGKFDKDGKPRGIPGHNIVVGALGVFILWFGWYGFNGAAATSGLQLATIFATTTVSPALAACTVMAFTWFRYGKPDVSMTLNGALAGLVAITAGCDAVNVWGACIIGIVSGLLCCLFVWLLDYKLHVDDPVGAVAVHFANGLWGTLAVGLFACGTETMPEAVGLFYGGGWQQLGIQAFGLLCIGAWTAVTIFLTFFCIKKTIGLRVTPHEEIQGLDKEEHGLDSAYGGFVFETDMSPYAPVEIAIPTSEKEVVVNVEDAVPVRMKEGTGEFSQVTIITKPDRFESLKNELDKIGIGGMTVTNVMGMGVQKGQTTYYRGAEVESKLLPKMKVEIVVSEVPVQKVIDATRKALYTGQMGDGKIFVYDVEQVVRISTGQKGKDALKYNEA